MQQTRVNWLPIQFVLPVRLLIAVSILSVIFSTLTLSTTAHAAQTTPYKINFQGRLVDGSGVPMPTGLYNMKLRFMNASSGGSNLWQADRVYTGSGTGDHRVQVTNGVFSIQLGDTAAAVGDPALSPSIFNTQTNATVYLEVELPTPATATCATVSCASFTEGPMTDRQLLATAAYAMNADTVDGIDGASLAQLSTSQSFTGNNTFTGTFLYQPASDSTTAFQIKNNAGAALLVADTTSNLAIKIGGGDVSPGATPALLVLDYKNTSGDPSNGVDGAMYYDSTLGRMRCREGGLWKDCTNGHRSKFEMRDDMMYGANHTFAEATNLIDGGLALRLGENGGSYARQASELNHPGILRFQAGNFFVSGNLAAMTSSLNTSAMNQVLFGTGTWTSNIMLRIPSTHLSDASNTYITYNGFMDGVTTTSIAPANGCYLKYSHGLNSGKWQGVCRSAGNETGSTCDTGVTVAVTNWYNLTVTVNAAATLATFSVYDTNAGTTSTCTANTNIPTAAISFGLGLYRATGSGNKAIDYDYVEYVGEGLSR